MPARPLLVRDPRFREHRPADAHPERPERLVAIDAALAKLRASVAELAPRLADDEEILWVHGAGHLAQLRAIDGRPAQLDPDTYASPASARIARLAAGSLVEAALRVARGEAPSAFAAIRPPGHHAERERAMGFCLLNNVAIAARALQRRAGVERIAIIDWDVHHGNGTQHCFEQERDVLYVSLHQFPLYPGTGALGERGSGAGLGSTVNLPLPGGAGDGEYGAVFDRIVVPVLRAFAPQLILVSAGFDAHADDPLASMQLSSGAYALFTQRLLSVAEECCAGRLVLALEGGYDLPALGASVAASVGALCAEAVPWQPFPPPRPSWEPVVAKLREAHAQTWPVLRGASTHLPRISRSNDS